MITANVLCRVFELQWNGSTGTCFAIDWNNRQYLVTARHLVETLQGKDKAKIFFDKKWCEIDVTLVGHGENSLDISVLSTSLPLGRKDLPLIMSLDKITLAQDVYFVGFPYGLKSSIEYGNIPFPLPLVKKAILSAITNDSNGNNIIMLDGHNNPGFSGAPVVFTHMHQESRFFVAGVISSYQAQITPVLSNTGTDTKMIIQENTGIIIAYSIHHAIDLIEKNPIGLLLN